MKTASSLYAAATSHFPNHNPRPLIAITANSDEASCSLADGYWRSVEEAGGIPVMVPPGSDVEQLLSLLDAADGLLLSGGADINPIILGEEPLPSLHGINARRDVTDLLLCRLAFDRQVPIFGICRGMQVMAAALGGSVVQDIATAMPGAQIVKHVQDAARTVPTHHVTAQQGSTVARLLGERFAVNSFHHQAVGQPGPHLRVTARAADGVPEAIESTEGKSLMGVQWHPECFILGDEPDAMMPLFRHFVADAQAFRAARQFHRTHLTLDSHCDTPMFFPQGVAFSTRDPKVLVDLHKMTEGLLDATIMVAYLEQLGRTEADLAAATDKANAILSQIETMVGSSVGARMAYTPADLYAAKQAGLRSVMPGIENAYAVGRDLSCVERFRRRGVVYMTLCHNGHNDVCDSARPRNGEPQAEHGGLSRFGREVVREMNRVGMMVDLSHASEQTFFDVLAESCQPVVCSHSSARQLCNHPRNLTDQQLRALAQAGGVAQATFYHGFLVSEAEGREATVDDAVRHILHMVSVAGIRHVGIGSDFDGDGGVPGLASASEMTNLTRRLMAEGLTDDDLALLWGGNFLRVMRQVQAAAQID